MGLRKGPETAPNIASDAGGLACQAVSWLSSRSRNPQKPSLPSAQDEEVLESCCLGVCDALESKFTDLLTALTALNTHRKPSDLRNSKLGKEIKDLASLHDAFMAKLDHQNAHLDSRYMKVNEPGDQATSDLAKRKRRSEYAEQIRTAQVGLQIVPETAPGL